MIREEAGRGAKGYAAAKNVAGPRSSAAGQRQGTDRGPLALRMQKRPYTLRATGWVRAASGLQSLLSVYLLALWALTYFGRPFE